MNKGLKECPFCGNSGSITISKASENGEYGVDPNYVCVCCDSTNGGCGACGGYHNDENITIDAWNKRVR